jgi:hypothetical protein
MPTSRVSSVVVKPASVAAVAVSCCAMDSLFFDGETRTDFAAAKVLDQIAVRRPRPRLGSLLREDQWLWRRRAIRNPDGATHGTKPMASC